MTNKSKRSVNCKMDINLIIDTMISTAKIYGIDLNKDDLNEIMQISTLKLFHKGDIIHQIGDENDNVGFVLNGLIRSYYLDENGNEKEIVHKNVKGVFVKYGSRINFVQIFISCPY